MKIRKFLPLLLALAMLLTAALPTMTAMAAYADLPEDATITVTGSTTVLRNAGDYTAYKLFNVTTSAGSLAQPDEKNYAYTPVQPAVDNFLTWAQLADQHNGASPYGATAYAFKEYLEIISEHLLLADASGAAVSDADNDALTAFTLDLMNYNAAATGLGYTPFATKASAQNGTDVRFSGLSYGYYLVVGQGQPNGTDLDKTGDKALAFCALITVDQLAKNGIIRNKTDVPTIDKNVMSHKADGSDDTWAKWTDVNIGDTVDFQLTSRVPVMTGYKSYTFIVHDTMSPGLTFDPTSIVVNIDGADYSTDKYTVVTHPDYLTDGSLLADGCTFEIQFDPDEFVKLNARNITDTGDSQSGYKYNMPIVITYSALLNGSAVIGNPGNPNDVELEYSNNPYTTKDGDGGQTGKTPKHRVIVYTFAIDVFKYTLGYIPGEVENGDRDMLDIINGTEGTDFEALADAKFTLRNERKGALVNFVALTGDPNYNYRVATPKDAPASTTTTLVSPADGFIKIKGLDEGSYILTETEAPYGFNKLIDTVTIVISRTFPGGETLATYSGHYDVSYGYTSYRGNEIDDALLGKGTVCILNETGPELPSTGGTGTTIFMLIGLLLIGCCTAGYILNKKRSVLNARNIG